MTEINRARLLEVVKGNWDSYARRTTLTFATPDMSMTPMEIVDTDFGLLRHDIHVLLHAATPTVHPEKP